MDLRLCACQGCPIAISNRVENRNWLVLVSLTRWRTNRKIIFVSNRPVSRYPMFQGAPVSPTLRCTSVSGLRCSSCVFVISSMSSLLCGEAVSGFAACSSVTVCFLSISRAYIFHSRTNVQFQVFC